ncbi:MAG: helix-turn-helix domain-containing protein [Bacteroidota bacterium]
MTSALWLSSLLFLLALYISPFMFGYAGWYGLYGYRQTLFYIPFQQLLFIGPIFLFYLKTLLYPAYSFTKRDWLHFLPGILYLAYSLLVFVVDILILEEIYFYKDGKDKDLLPWYQITGFISMIAYFILSFRLYLDYRKNIFNTLSYAEEITYNWVRLFLLTFLLIIVLRILFFIFNPEWAEFGRKLWYYLAISFVAYFLAIKGSRQSILLSVSTIQDLTKGLTLDILENQSEEVSVEKEETTFNHEVWLQRIEQKMQEEDLYKNSALTLLDLAQALDTTTKTISQTVNQGTGLNFNDYINRFRIEAFKDEILAKRHEQLTLLGIAIACGFNSKSTFNRAFKKHSGQSPSEFLRNLE